MNCTTIYFPIHIIHFTRNQITNILKISGKPNLVNLYNKIENKIQILRTFVNSLNAHCNILPNYKYIFKNTIQQLAMENKEGLNQRFDTLLQVKRIRDLELCVCPSLLNTRYCRYYV